MVSRISSINSMSKQPPRNAIRFLFPKNIRFSNRSRKIGENNTTNTMTWPMDLSDSYSDFLSSPLKGSLKRHWSAEIIWLVVSTPLKNISQNGNLPQIGMKIKNIWNHHLGNYLKSSNMFSSVPTSGRRGNVLPTMLEKKLPSHTGMCISPKMLRGS